jgi:hypothetical protein
MFSWLHLSLNISISNATSTTTTATTTTLLIIIMYVVLIAPVHPPFLSHVKEFSLKRNALFLSEEWLMVSAKV